MRIHGLAWFLLQILFVAGVSTRCLDDQRKLLLHLKSSLVFDPTYSRKLVKWNQSDDDCCKWDGIDCDDAGRVISLNLKDEGISGGIENSTALFRFQYLRRLDLAFNSFNGSLIPKGLQNLTNLEYLDLSYAYFGGQVPDIIFQIQTQQILDLSNNNLLSGTIQQIPLNSSFRTMVLSYTNFSGSLPISISNARMLSWIELSNCHFSGLIPSTISDLTQLVFVDLSSNYFTGPIPSFSLSNKLNILDLSNNSLNGSLSPKHFEGLANLVNLNLDSNNLLGSIPSSLFGLLSLRYLSLSGNKFSGQIAEFPISNPFVLESLDLSSNQLEGSIPESLFKLQGLSYLLLSSNLFNGTLKLETFQSLGNLTTLALGYNKLLVDTSTSSLSGFPQLGWLDLASCNLAGFGILEVEISSI